MADTGGSASLAAEVELNMGHGNPATLQCLKYGLRPSISIDVCTSVGSDMFTQIRILMAASRGVVNAEALRQNRLLDPVPLTVKDMLDFATLQGAKTANLDHEMCIRDSPCVDGEGRGCGNDENQYVLMQVISPRDGPGPHAPRSMRS